MPFVVLGVIAYFLLSKVGKGVVSIFTSDPVEPFPVLSSKMSKTKAVLKEYSDRLYNSMKGFGTDEETIDQIFSEINDQDFIYIYNHFGNKVYLGFGRAAWFGDQYRLTEWLKFECSDKHYQSIKERFENTGLPFP